NLFLFPEAFESCGGYRAFFTLGQKDSLQATIGTDFNYIVNRVNEFQNIDLSFGGFANIPVLGNNPVPDSYLQDPGVFADFSLPLLEDNRLTIRGGARFDWVRTAIANLQTPLPNPAIAGSATPDLFVVNPTSPPSVSNFVGFNQGIAYFSQ